MKRTSFVIAILAFIFIVLAHPSFSATIQLKSWQPYSGIGKVSYEADSLIIESVSPMPVLVSPDNLLIDAKKYHFLVLKIRASSSYSIGRLFFKRIGDSDFDMNNMQELHLGRSGRYYSYVIDLNNNPLWSGMVSRLVLQPVGSVGKVEIREMALSEYSLPLWLSSVRQEYFRFERPVPLTINLIYGPKIGGSSANGIVYIVIIIISLLLMIYFAAVKRNIRSMIDSTVPAILFLCLVFWILLDARTAMDQLRAAMLDRDTFSGKTLEERQALATYGNYYDFYYFVKFCGSKMPVGSSFSLNVPPNFYYMHEKAKYYLYPTYEIADGEYVLVYDPENYYNGKLPKGYGSFATYKPGQYILKRLPK